MTDLGITVALTGDLRKIMDRQTTEVAKALRLAVADTAEETKNDLRKQVRRAGLGRGLEKAWRVQLFPRRRSIPTLGPAAIVFSKAPRLHAAFDRDNVIKTRTAKWLVIPSDVAVRAKLHLSRARSAGSRLRKWSEVAKAGVKFGRLVFVQKSPDTAFLIARKATPTGRISKAKRRRKSDRGQVIFVLKKQVRSPKLLNIEAVARLANRRLARNVAKHLGRLDRTEGRAA